MTGISLQTTVTPAITQFAFRIDDGMRDFAHGKVFRAVHFAIVDGGAKYPASDMDVYEILTVMIFADQTSAKASQLTLFSK